MEHAPITGTDNEGDPLEFGHVYLDDDPSAHSADLYVIHLTLTDDDTGFGEDGLLVQVKIRRANRGLDLRSSCSR